MSRGKRQGAASIPLSDPSAQRVGVLALTPDLKDGGTDGVDGRGRERRLLSKGGKPQLICSHDRLRALPPPLPARGKTCLSGAEPEEGGMVGSYGRGFGGSGKGCMHVLHYVLLHLLPFLPSSFSVMGWG